MVILSVFLGFLVGLGGNYLSDLLIKKRGLLPHPNRKTRWIIAFVLLFFFTIAIWNISELHRYMPRYMATLVLVYFAVVFIIDFEYKLMLKPSPLDAEKVTHIEIKLTKVFEEQTLPVFLREFRLKIENQQVALKKTRPDLNPVLLTFGRCG